MTELLKDVDSLDRFLYGIEKKGAYRKRCRKVLEEIDLTNLKMKND